MPVISRFYGIMIAMYFMDHNPPHLHAKYAGFEALYDFSGNLIEGELPNRASIMVKDWIALHRNELESNWKKAQQGVSLDYITPLE